MKSKILGLLAVGVLAGPMSVGATPVTFTYTSSVTQSAIAGVSVGDVVTITLLADNGGAGLASQSWTIASLISGSLTAGTYWQSYVDGWFSSDSHVAFTTDAAGNLTSSLFYGTSYSPNHTDSFGVGPGVYLYNGSFQDFYYKSAYQSHLLVNLERWTVAVASVPEPGSLALFGLGLAGLGLSRRRKAD